MFNSFAQSVYFAPRGEKRLMLLGDSLSQKYLSPTDKLIGLIGEGGSGKSLLIKGMFPGLKLTNDDNGVEMRPLPLCEGAQQNNFTNHTYHVDAKFETAFTQPWELGSAIQEAIENERRVVIEHFELIAEYLSMDADLLVGIGEEVLITRPGVFGPEPEEIVEIVFDSIKYRRMAHTAEDLTSKVLEEEMGVEKSTYHSDIKSGFVLQFEDKPEFDFEQLEASVNEIIDENLPVSFHDEHSISLGEDTYSCTGPRIHVNKTGDINYFRLIKELKYDAKIGRHLLVGFVGEERSQFELSHK